MAGGKKKAIGNAKKVSEKEKAKKYKNLQNQIFDYCNKNNLHVLITDMMNKAFLANVVNPTLFMAKYLLELNQSNVEEHCLKEVIYLKHQIEQYQEQLARHSDENEYMKRKIAALERQLKIPSTAHPIPSTSRIKPPMVEIPTRILQNLPQTGPVSTKSVSVLTNAFVKKTVASMACKPTVKCEIVTPTKIIEHPQLESSEESDSTRSTNEHGSKHDIAAVAEIEDFGSELGDTDAFPVTNILLKGPHLKGPLDSRTTIKQEVVTPTKISPYVQQQLELSEDSDEETLDALQNKDQIKTIDVDISKKKDSPIKPEEKKENEFDEAMEVDEELPGASSCSEDDMNVPSVPSPVAANKDPVLNSTTIHFPPTSVNMQIADDRQQKMFPVMPPTITFEVNKQIDSSAGSNISKQNVNLTLSDLVKDLNYEGFSETESESLMIDETIRNDTLDNNSKEIDEKIMSMEQTSSKNGSLPAISSVEFSELFDDLFTPKETPSTQGIETALSAIDENDPIEKQLMEMEGSSIVVETKISDCVDGVADNCIELCPSEDDLLIISEELPALTSNSEESSEKQVEVVESKPIQRSSSNDFEDDFEPDYEEY